ncbi:MAG: hypothetical protein CXT71_01900 [Methanobacteriota archaeon]|jgi:hypothetical protein|nr:MAG: hypothetical protein CXT71_01900 [Euryarchaeota archaeon]
MLAEVIVMNEEDRFEILISPENGNGVYTHTMKAIDNLGDDLTLVPKEVPHVESALELLLDGHADMMAVSANWWFANRRPDLKPAVVLPRREPTMVLVSEDKPEYVPSKGIIVAQSELLKRQFIRARPDVKVVLASELENAPEHALERANWLEDKRLDNEIDGYIIPRSLHATLPFRARRHTLGLQRENPERFRFVPPPLEGFTIFLARLDFPAARFFNIIDAGAAITLRLELMLLDHIPDDLRNKVGLIFEQRKVGAVLREATRAGDELFAKGIVSDKGKIKGSSRIDGIIEFLNSDGSTTACVEKVFPLEEAHSGSQSLLTEFNALLTVMCEVPEEEERVRIKQMIDDYTEDLIQSGRLSENRIGTSMMRDY